jgi:uncharacterized protein (TIGR02300 family)
MLCGPALIMPAAFDSGLSLWQGAARPRHRDRRRATKSTFIGDFSPMVKAEWGTKRTCPKCGTRFYDLGKEDPVTCIACGIAWDPEPVLKSKQPLPYDEPAKAVAEKPETDDTDLAAETLDIDEDAEENPDDEVDLGGDDDIGVPGAGGDNEEV